MRLVTVVLLLLGAVHGVSKEEFNKLNSSLVATALGLKKSPEGFTNYELLRHTLSSSFYTINGGDHYFIDSKGVALLHDGVEVSEDDEIETYSSLNDAVENAKSSLIESEATEDQINMYLDLLYRISEN